MMGATMIPPAMPLHGWQLFFFFFWMLIFFYLATDYDTSHIDNTSHAHAWMVLFVFCFTFFLNTNYIVLKNSNYSDGSGVPSS